MSDRQEIRARRLPRLLVNTSEAAEMMGMGRDTFRSTVAPYVRSIPVGTRDDRRWPVSELERWIEQKANQAAID